MARVTKGGRLYCGWHIALPTIGNGHMYTATSAVRPGVEKRFPSMGRAMDWCAAHDVTREDMAAATAGAGWIMAGR